MIDHHVGLGIRAGELTALDIGKWITTKGLDKPKQVISVIHNANSTAIHWYRDPERRDAKKSGMVASHDTEVTVYDSNPAAREDR